MGRWWKGKKKQQQQEQALTAHIPELEETEEQEEDLSEDEFLEDDEAERQLVLDTNSEVREWLEFVSRPEVDVVIADEVEQKRMFIVRKKNVFTVRTKKLASGDVVICKRSFREFKRLETTLKERFTGALVPPLPKPNISVGKMIEWLRLFMREIARNPVFRSDSAFQKFCSNETKKFDDKTVSDLSGSSHGMMNWPQVLDSVPLPKGMLGKIKELGKETAAMEAMYIKLRDGIKKNQQMMKTQAKYEREMALFYEKWRQKETDTFPHLYGMASDPTGALTRPDGSHTVDMPSILQSIQSISDERAKTTNELADVQLEKSQQIIHIELIYLSELQKMIAEVKAAIKRHKSGMHELSELKTKIDQNLQKVGPPSPNLPLAAADGASDGWNNLPPMSPVSPIDTQTDSLSSPGPISTPLPKNHRKIERRSINLEKTIRDKQTNLKRMIRGVLFETDRYRFERTSRSSTLLFELAELESKNVTAQASVCTKVLEDIPSSVPPVSHLSCVNAFFDKSRQAEATVVRHVTRDLNIDAAAISASIPVANKEMLVLYDFDAEENGELSISRGETVQVIKQESGEAGWCQVKNGTGEVGLVPVAYLGEPGTPLTPHGTTVQSPVASPVSSPRGSIASAPSENFERIEYVSSSNQNIEKEKSERRYSNPFALEPEGDSNALPQQDDAAPPKPPQMGKSLQAQICNRSGIL